MDHKEEKMKDKKMWVFNYVLVTGYMRSALRLGGRFSVDQVWIRYINLIDLLYDNEGETSSFTLYSLSFCDRDNVSRIHAVVTRISYKSKSELNS